jgi:predicted PurR-regulated permease PerM
VFPPDPQEPRLVAWTRNPRIRRTLILGTLWTFVGVILVLFHQVLLPFGLAILLSFILEPIVGFVSAKKLFGRPISRLAAVLSIYLVMLAGGWLFGSWAVRQISHEISKVGTLSSNLIHEIEPMTETLLSGTVQFAEDNNLPVSREEIESIFRQNLTALAEEMGHNTSRVLGYGKELVGGTFKGIFGTFLVLMLTAFLSIDRERILRFIASLVPPEYKTAYGTISSGINVGLAGVVRGQVLICLTNGLFTFIGLMLLGVKLPLLLATLATVFSLIPIFGSILSSIPIVAVALTDSLPKGVFALLWIIGIHLMEANLLNPKIMGDAAKIHPVLVVFALLVGEQTGGLIGALFAVPTACVVLTVFQFMHRRALDAVRPGETVDLLAPTRDLPSSPPVPKPPESFSPEAGVK